MNDLPTAAFLALHSNFFDTEGKSIPFNLRDKRNTQDDPFDESLANEVLSGMSDIECVKAGGPLITPDMVLYRPSLCEVAGADDLADDTGSIVGIEVKKLERTATGGVARSSGMDYNTTPPCGRIRVYDAAGSVLDIRGFYLFVCLERAPDLDGAVMLTAMCLVDGNVLNEDFDLYLKITGEREKQINLGTYGDGADRARPMLLFANPLGVKEFDRVPCLIHPRNDVLEDEPDLFLTHTLQRTTHTGDERSFSCYRHRNDVPANWTISNLIDPFPTPEREARTRPRGKFRLPFRL